jgi:hypothetical protein
MMKYITGKVLVVLIMIAPVLFVNGCDKQEKCGCDGDILFSINPDHPANPMDYASIYVLAEGAIMKFQIGYDTYTFCNPVEMYEIYKNLNPDHQIKISGDVFWDCSYVSSASQSSYYAYYYKYYNIRVTEMKSHLYGK